MSTPSEVGGSAPRSGPERVLADGSRRRVRAEHHARPPVGQRARIGPVDSVVIRLRHWRLCVSRRRPRSLSTTLRWGIHGELRGVVSLRIQPTMATTE
ncbi:hypothetical protein RHA1_ro00043 [Rhodococcus jostii RHA1]|uniref:Uncharacterized protein n=1 Tax=Rhodococcus jostii (strain RHA1) TaxID=101510 RepID=Q0SKQ7_RHOJR|nr:hypothetical protein RHA1_ro00043 [Rhodococcus jostii RHA1]